MLMRTISLEVLQRKTITARKDKMKENVHDLVEEVEGQQEDFVNSEIEGPMVKHRRSFKKKEEEHQSTT